MKTKYPALNTITNVFRILGWVNLLWTAAIIILGVVFTFLSGQYLGAGFFGFLGEVLGALWGSLLVLVFYGVIGGALSVFYFAAAESIQVLIDIEQNTQKS